MNAAIVCEGGLVRSPAEILSPLGLKLGDKVSFIQNQNGEVVLSKASVRAIMKAQEAFAGAAEILYVKNDNDVMALVNEVRCNDNNAQIEAALSIFHELREKACDISDMTLEEINREIKAARAEKRADS